MTAVPGSSRPDRARGVESFQGVSRRHPDVNHHEIRPVDPCAVHEVVTPAHLPDDVESRALEQTRHTFTEEYVVVGKDDSTPRARCRLGGEVGRHGRIAVRSPLGVLPGAWLRGTLTSTTRRLDEDASC